MTVSGSVPRCPGAPNVISALLLDDSAFDRQRICRMGEAMDLSIRFQEAPTLAALSALLDEDNFDLVLIDYWLGEGDGFGALEILQASDKNRNAAKIMISGNARIDVAVSALKRGCHDYLSKQDISAQTLRDSIAGALNQSAARERQDSTIDILQRDGDPVASATLSAFVRAFCDSDDSAFRWPDPKPAPECPANDDSVRH